MFVFANSQTLFHAQSAHMLTTDFHINCKCLASISSLYTAGRLKVKRICLHRHHAVVLYCTKVTLRKVTLASSDLLPHAMLWPYIKWRYCTSHLTNLLVYHVINTNCWKLKSMSSAWHSLEWCSKKLPWNRSAFSAVWSCFLKAAVSQIKMSSLLELTGYRLQHTINAHPTAYVL
jgi:hypothetical protein